MTYIEENIYNFRRLTEATLQTVEGEEWSASYLTLEACDSALRALKTNHITYVDVSFMVIIQEKWVEFIQQYPETIKDRPIEYLTDNLTILKGLKEIMANRKKD